MVDQIVGGLTSTTDRIVEAAYTPSSFGLQQPTLSDSLALRIQSLTGISFEIARRYVNEWAYTFRQSYGRWPNSADAAEDIGLYAGAAKLPTWAAGLPSVFQVLEPDGTYTLYDNTLYSGPFAVSLGNANRYEDQYRTPAMRGYLARQFGVTTGDPAASARTYMTGGVDAGVAPDRPAATGEVPQPSTEVDRTVQRLGPFGPPPGYVPPDPYVAEPYDAGPYEPLPMPSAADEARGNADELAFLRQQGQQHPESGPRTTPLGGAPIIMRELLDTLIAAYQASIRGGGGGRGVTFDREAIKQGIQNQWKSYLLQDPGDVDTLADEYIRQATSFYWQGGSLQLDAWTWAKMRESARYKMMYGTMPKGMTEDQYLGRTQNLVQQFGFRPEVELAETEKTMAAPNLDLESVAQRLGRTKEYQTAHLGDLSQRFAATFNSLAVFGGS